MRVLFDYIAGWSYHKPSLERGKRYTDGKYMYYPALTEGLFESRAIKRLGHIKYIVTKQIYTQTVYKVYYHESSDIGFGCSVVRLTEDMSYRDPNRPPDRIRVGPWNYLCDRQLDYGKDNG